MSNMSNPCQQTQSYLFLKLKNKIFFSGPEKKKFMFVGMDLTYLTYYKCIVIHKYP